MQARHADPAGFPCHRSADAPTNPRPRPRQDRNITICDGAQSRIVCAMQANRRHARYCIFRHLRLDESSAATSGGGGRALFTAHCRPTAAWAQLDPAASAADPSPRALAASSLFAGMGAFSPFKWVARQSSGAARCGPKPSPNPDPDPHPNLQVGKGRDMGFVAVNGFEQKISAGNALSNPTPDPSL